MKQWLKTCFLLKHIHCFYTKQTQRKQVFSFCQLLGLNSNKLSNELKVSVSPSGPETTVGWSSYSSAYTAHRKSNKTSLFKQAAVSVTHISLSEQQRVQTGRDKQGRGTKWSASHLRGVEVHYSNTEHSGSKRSGLVSLEITTRWVKICSYRQIIH